MTKALDEKADEATNDDYPECVRARDAHGVYQPISLELSEADEVTDEGDFPMYGDWLPVRRLGRSGRLMDEAWLECPGHLAETLVDEAVDDESVFIVRNVAKDSEGRFRFDIETEHDIEPQS